MTRQVEKEEAYKWFNLGVAYADMCEYTQTKEEILADDIHRKEFEDEWRKLIEK